MERNYTPFHFFFRTFAIKIAKVLRLGIKNK